MRGKKAAKKAEREIKAQNQDEKDKAKIVL